MSPKRSRPTIQRVPQSVQWLLTQIRNWSGEKNWTISEVTRNGRFPVVYFWQTYQPGGGDDGVDMTIFNDVLPEDLFQREFSKRKRHLHFPVVCEIDTRKPENGGDGPTVE